MEVRFEASFERDLKKLKDKRLLKNVKEIIDDIKKAQNLDEISNLSKLKGYKTFYRIRLGDYRIGGKDRKNTITSRLRSDYARP